MTELQGKDFIALRRLSDADDRTIADVGQTCEHVPAATSGGTASDALARLLASGKIAPVDPHETKADRSDARPIEPAEPFDSAAPPAKRKGRAR